MAPVAVVTDTTHYAPTEVLEAYGIHEVSLYVNQGERHDREADLPDFEAFYEHLRTARELPTTSQPSIGDFLAVYDPLAAAGHDIVSVHISASISGTCESARQAAADVMERHHGRCIEIVDSKTTAGGLAMCAMAGARLAREGGDVQAVAARVREAMENTRIWFAVDTLEFLRRGGRIGAAQAWLGGALKIKPILTIEGEITPIERVRTAGRAFERLVGFLEARHQDGADGWVIQHVQAADQAAAMLVRGREIFGSEPLFVSEVGPVIGTHVGPGLLGVGGVPRSMV